ncbi:MAG: winged helix-turn-helix domain-containing protein, partial [Elusimicrobiaceae bacterium]
NLTPQDIVDIYNSGAVDFVKADMPIAVIGAKIRAYIRRLSTVKVPPAEGGAIRFDASTRRVFVPERGRWVTVSSLTPKEFSILWYLASKKGDVATRVEILDSIWNADALKVNMETVDKHVESLRKKLGKYARSVKTVYGSGYYFDKESIEEELKAKGA